MGYYLTYFLCDTCLVETRFASDENVTKGKGEVMTAQPSCFNCVYSIWDLDDSILSMRSRLFVPPRCANQPGAAAQMKRTPGRICPNYRARPPKPEGDVKAIPLADGFYAYIDAADYEWVSKYNWRIFGGGYAARHEKGKMIFMHREIMKPPEGMVVDHIDGSKANNCRINLRVCTRQENQRNRAKTAGAVSRFKGVWFDKRVGKWRATIHMKGKSIFIGHFEEEEEAARAYDRKAVELFGEFARLNFPDEWPPERKAEVLREKTCG